MSDDLSHIRERLDQIADILREHAEILARNTASLELHMKRSDALEKIVDDLVRFRYYLMGAIAIISVAGPLIYKRFL